jgi:hypothetical protein
MNWKKSLYPIKKWTVCYWSHHQYRCYSEVWDRGLEGPWHCTKCVPCSLELEECKKKPTS